MRRLSTRDIDFERLNGTRAPCSPHRNGTMAGCLVRSNLGRAVSQTARRSNMARNSSCGWVLAVGRFASAHSVHLRRGHASDLPRESVASRCTPDFTSAAPHMESHCASKANAAISIAPRKMPPMVQALAGEHVEKPHGRS